ncbi:MAG: porin [Rubellimicrobium sp.]|nr:porin [Rubellimicrobium sp.]
MNITRSIITAALAALPGLAAAQGFQGAEVSAALTAFDGSGGVDISNYAAGMQFGIGAGISVELDFGLNNFHFLSGDSHTTTLHGIYELSPGMSAGLFYAQERGDGAKLTSYGIEGTSRFGALDLAGYLGRMEIADLSATAIGIEGTMDIGSAMAVSVGLDRVSGAGEDGTNVSIGGEYRFASGPAVFAEIGRLSDDTDSQNYLSIGARVAIGNGTAFGNRGISDMIGGGF